MLSCIFVLAFGHLPTAQAHAPKLTLSAPNLDTACSRLAATYENAVLTSENNTLYEKQREAHWSQTAWKHPACIYTPTSADELRYSVSTLVRNNGTFAVRGGGHSPLPLWASSDGGVLISTKMIKDTEWDETSNSVHAGMGNSWGDLYEYLEQFNRTVLGGRAPGVGLATVMGGGLSHLSNLYGFVSDSVLEFELLNSSGDMITANSTSNTDLFFALKAGATNFGIVTHVTMKTYALGKVWGGALVYTNEHRDDVMRAMATYQESGQLDRHSALLSYMGINNNTLYVILAYMNGVEKPAAFEPFYQIPNIFDGTRMRDNLTDLISEDIDRVVPRWAFGATTFLLDSDTYVDVARIAQNATANLATINGGSMVLMPQPISSSMITESTSRGANPMTVNLKNTAQMWLCINMGWNLESDDSRIGEIMMDTLSRIETLTKSRSLYHEFVFLNDAYMDQDPLRSYGLNTYRKLLRIRRTADPSGFFQQRLAGGFKLGA